MKPLHNLSVLLLSLAFSLAQPTTHAQTTDPHVAAVLAQMDAASQRFKSARAEASTDNYQAVVKETDNQSGPIYFQRVGSATQMGSVILDPGTKKPLKVIQYKDGILRYWDIPNNQVQEFKAGGNQAKYDALLTLGFGGKGSDLERAWTIKDDGAETLSDGNQPVKVEKLELVSKDPSVRNIFTRVTIWVDPVRGVSLRQVFDTPEHDRRTVTYSHIKVNESIDTATFSIKKGVPVVSR